MVGVFCKLLLYMGNVLIVLGFLAGGVNICRYTGGVGVVGSNPAVPTILPVCLYSVYTLLDS